MESIFYIFISKFVYGIVFASSVFTGFDLYDFVRWARIMNIRANPYNKRSFVGGVLRNISRIKDRKLFSNMLAKKINSHSSQNSVEFGFAENAARIAGQTRSILFK